jgi:hypothetical protein
MKQKKYGQFLCAAVLLFTVLSVSCSNLFTQVQPNSGTGQLAVSLNWNSQPSGQRCSYPESSGVTFTYALLNNDATKSATGIHGALSSGADSTYTASNLPPGTYYVQVDGHSGTATVLTGISTAPVTITRSDTPTPAAVVLSWVASASQPGGTASLTVEITSAYPFNQGSVFTASFTPLETGSAVTFTSSGDSAPLVFKSTGTTAAGYTYTVSAQKLDLPEGTYTLSLTTDAYGSDMLTGEDTSVVIASGLSTALSYQILSYYKNIYVKSGTTGGTGTIRAPYASLSAAFSAVKDSPQPVQINLLDNYTTDNSDMLLTAGSCPVVVNLRYYALHNTQPGVLFNSDGTGTLTLMNGTIDFTAVSSDAQYLLTSQKSDIILSNVVIDMQAASIPAVYVCTNLYMKDSRIAYSARAGGTPVPTAVDLESCQGVPAKLHMSETGGGNTYILNGYVSVSSGAALYADTPLAAACVAVVNPQLASLTVPTAVFGLTQNITPSQWPLLTSAMKYNADLTVSAIPGGYMYGISDSDPYNTQYTISKGSFGSTGTFTAAAGVEPYTGDMFDTAFDSNGFCFILTYFAISDMLSLRTPFGGLDVTGIPAFPSGNAAPFTFAADSTNDRIIIAAYDTGSEPRIYTVSGVMGNGKTNAAAVDTGAVVPLDANEVVKKIAYDAVKGYLYAIVTDQNVDYFKRFTVSDTTFTPGHVTLSLNSKSNLTFENTYNGSTFDTKNLVLSDLAVMGNKIYLLASFVNTAVSAFYGQYSIGELVVMPCGPGSAAVGNTSVYGKFSDQGGNIKPNVDAFAAGWNYTPTGAWKAGNSNAKTEMFYGPERFVALTPEKVVISDTGFELSSTELNKIKRTMLFDIGTSTLSAGADINDYSFFRAVSGVGSSFSSITNKTNGIPDAASPDA